MENKIKKMATRIENPFTLEQFIEDRGIIEFVRWYDSKILSLNPEFQRSYKWSKKQASELIESFLLGLPVPNIFLYKENNQRLVIDGVQRLTTIIGFFKNRWYCKEGDKKDENGIRYCDGFALDFRDNKSDLLDYKWQGKTIETLEQDDKLRLENFSQLRVATIKQEDPNDNTSIYYLFERLNSGGTKLTSMEVRNSIYRGKLLDKLKEISQNETFRSLVRKNKDDKNDETIYEEVLLRIFAFYDGLDKYLNDTTLVKFLNDYCKQHKNADENWLQSKAEIFNDAINNSKFIAFIQKFMASKSNSILEALFVIYFRSGGKINLQVDAQNITGCLKNLPKSGTYSSNNIKRRFEEIEKLIKQ